MKTTPRSLCTPRNDVFLFSSFGFVLLLLLTPVLSARYRCCKLIEREDSQSISLRGDKVAQKQIQECK